MQQPWVPLYNKAHSLSEVKLELFELKAEVGSEPWEWRRQLHRKTPLALTVPTPSLEMCLAQLQQVKAVTPLAAGAPSPLGHGDLGQQTWVSSVGSGVTALPHC